MTDERDLDIEPLNGSVVIAFVAALGAADPAVRSGADCLALAERLARAEKACAAARVRFAARAEPTTRRASPRGRTGPLG